MPAAREGSRSPVPSLRRVRQGAGAAEPDGARPEAAARIAPFPARAEIQPRLKPRRRADVRRIELGGRTPDRTRAQLLGFSPPHPECTGARPPAPPLPNAAF